MKQLLLLCLLSLVISTASCQIKSKNFKYSAEWVAGRIFLEAGDTVSCDFRYNPIVSEGLLEVKDGETVLTLSVKDVKGFTYYDEKRSRSRWYYTLTLPLSEGPEREFFVEYVYGNDKISILNHKVVDVPYDYMNYSRFISKSALVNKKYLLDIASGKILPMSKQNALNLLQANRREVMGYIETNDIKFKKVSDYISVFEYYSSL